MKKVIKRTLVKTVIWRLIGSMDTFVVSYIVTGTFETALKIGGIGLFTKMIMYFIHELIWSKQKKKERRMRFHIPWVWNSPNHSLPFSRPKSEEKSAQRCNHCTGRSLSN